MPESRGGLFLAVLSKSPMRLTCKIIVIMLHVLDRLLPIDKRAADQNRVSQNNLTQLTVPLSCK